MWQRVHVASLHGGVCGGFWGQPHQKLHLFLESWVLGVDIGGSLLLLLFLLQKMSTALRLLSAGLR